MAEGAARLLAVTLARWTLALMAIAMVTLAHTPYCWPTFVFALAPLMTIWRGRLAPRHISQVIIEASLFGAATAWLITPFFTQAAAVRISQGFALHAFCCAIYGLVWVVGGVAMWLTRSWRIVSATPLVAVALVLAESLSSRYIPLTWIGSNPILAVAATPIAQWASLLTTFSFSAVVYWLSCLWLPDFSQRGIVRWSSTLLAIILFSGLWGGGAIIERRLSAEPLAFVALMVQPASANSEQLAVWEIQDRLTIDGLQANDLVDLVVWPEALLNESQSIELTSPIAEADKSLQIGKAMPMLRFRRELLPKYQTNCLVGVSIRKPADIVLEGRMYPAMAKYNCGCLVSYPSGAECHEKLVLMPMTEALPKWFEWLPEVRNWLLPSRNPLELYQPGSDFRPLTFSDHSGATRRIGVAICYESWLPWLPQYHFKEPLDVICHLAYDGDFKDHPEYTQRMLLTIRLRAIETRTWQLVCSHYAGTAVIDPRGRIVKQLPPGPGVLRTDQ